MKKFTFSIFLLFSCSLYSQSLSNYEYARMQQPQYSDWTCGARSFNVTGDVLINVPPDGWVLELTGSEEQSTLTETRSKIQVRIDGLIKKLNARGIPTEDIAVTTVSQEKVSGYKLNEKGVSVYTTIAYSLTKSLRIRYKESSLYSSILSDASFYALDDVQQNYCTVADEQAVYAELYRQAMEVVLQKRDADISFYDAGLVPGAESSDESYDVQLPDPNRLAQAGAPRIQTIAYDRVLNPEYGSNAVKYMIHLNYAYTLQKPTKIISPKPKTR